MRIRRCIVALLLTAWVAHGQDQPPITCGALTTCSETGTFIAAITDFRPVVMNTNNKSLTFRLSFRNKLNRPLILGYVAGSAVGVDDKGNRYMPYGDQAIRGIGQIAGNNVDTKFTLQPGEASEARFELSWRNSSQAIFGLNFELDLTIREIEALQANQFQLGREHAMHFTGLSANANAAVTAAPAAGAPVAAAATSPAPAPASPAPAAAPAAAPAPLVDICAGKAGCYSTGVFLAEIAGLTPSQVGRYHMLDVRVRFRNLTNDRIILGYNAGSSAVTDNYGARYVPKDEGTRGIGLVQAGRADPQFVLNPGASGNVTFQLYRVRYQDSPVGASYNFDVTIAHLEVLASQQIRTVRDYSVSFTDIGASAMSAAPATNVNDAAKKLGDIFRRKK